MIKYSGATITTTTFETGADADAMCVNIQAALEELGFTYISGEGTNDCVMRSGLSPQGLGFRLRIRATSSGSPAITNVDFLLQDYDGLIAQRSTSSTKGCFLGWAESVTFTIIGTPFWFFAFPLGSAVQRGFVAAGVPRVHDFLLASCTNCAFLVGMNSAYNGGVLESWRAGAFVTNQAGANEAIWNNTRLYKSTLNYLGAVILAPALGPSWPLPSVSVAVQFAGTDQDLCTEAMIGWGLSSMDDEAQCVGQLWDACAMRNRFTTDAEDTFDGHDWHQVMNPVGGTYSAFGSLWCCTS